MSTLLELRGVEKRYNNGTLALLDSVDTAGRLWLEPRNRSWTRPSGSLRARLGRRDNASRLLPARRINDPRRGRGGSIGCVALSPKR